MRLRHTVALVLILYLILGSEVSGLVMAQSRSGSQLRVVSSDQDEIVLELTIADFQVEAVEQAGQAYQRINITDMVQTDTPGSPQVPLRGTTIGLSSTSGLSVEILETDSERLTGYRLLPAPNLRIVGDELLDGGVEEVFTLDQALYGADTFYPGQPVTIGEPGLMRDQALVAVHFYPVQYNPVRAEIELYRRIVARIRWDSAQLTAAEARPASPAYESVLRNTLLNYDALPRPAIGPIPHPDQDEGDIGATSATPALKIGVTEDGLYALTRNDLINAGFNLSGTDPRTIKITNRGVEIPIYVPGEGDGVFDPVDTILFYGTAVTDVYTKKNIYRLTAGGANGKRMSTRNVTPQGATVPSHFPVTLHAEENNSYWQSMPNGTGQDHWFWQNRIPAPSSRDYTVSLNNISSAASTATMRVRLRGFTDANLNPDHHTQIYLNNSPKDDQLWDGQISFEHQFTLPHANLNNGDNIIKVEGVGDTGAAVDQFYVNWIEIDYWDTYVAENDRLVFGAPAAGTFQFEVTAFSGNSVEAYDITDPGNPWRLTNTNVFKTGGKYTIQLQDAAQLSTRYLALAPAQRKAPASIELDQPSSWKSTSNGADYIIITHEDFYASAQTLANHRRSKGLRVATVKVGDIYDEFNHGIFNPQAIRDFLAFAYGNWVAPAPTYVILVGDAHLDFRDNYGLGKTIYVPAQIIETDLLGETPSDNWFVTVSGNDIVPDMFIGRISADQVSQVDDMIDKIIQYEQSPPSDSWNNQVLLVADDDSTTFEDISDQLADLLPADFSAKKVYARGYPPGDPTADIDNGINGGSVLVNYTGHGNSTGWGSWSGGRIYDTGNIQGLNNTNKLPVVTVANCLNGFFTGVTPNPSLAEAFLQLDDEGAVAVWAPTGLGYPSGHRALMTEFYRALFKRQQYGLGAATTAAKITVAGQNTAWDEIVQTYVFFGDPALRLGGFKSTYYLPLLIK